MKLKEYLLNINFEDIWFELTEYYPEQKNSKEGYLKVWKQLYELEESNKCSDITIDIEYIEEGEDSYYKVSGRKENDDMSYSLIYTSWDKWLGMSISDNCLKYRKEFSLAHILWEMTWSGFDSDIRSHLNIIRFSMESVKVGYPPEGLVGKKLRRWKKDRKLRIKRINKLVR